MGLDEEHGEGVEMELLVNVERELSFSGGISEAKHDTDPRLRLDIEGSAQLRSDSQLDRTVRNAQSGGRGQFKELSLQGKSSTISVGQELHSADPNRPMEGEFSFHQSAITEPYSDEESERDLGFADSLSASKYRSYRRVSSRKYENGYASREGAESSQEPDANAGNPKSNGVIGMNKAGIVLSRWSNLSPMLKTILRTLFFVIMWYLFSTSLTLYNKLLLGAEWGKFPAPLLMNTIHFSMQALISTFMLRLWCPSLLPTVSMSWKAYCVRVVPTALATALDIDLSNASIVSITVTFATMCKSAAPVFLLLFAFAFKLETPSFKLLGIIFIISTGVLLTVARETEFKVWGFILIMLATIMSGFRWVVTQILLQKEEYGLSNPFAAMNCLTPLMAVVTGVFSLIIEPWHKLRATSYFDTPHHFLTSCLLMLLGGSLAFCMVVAEYLLISETSAVTFTIAGVVKEVVTIVVAIFFFGDHFTGLTAVGLAIIIIGVSLFNWFKYQKLVEGKAELGRGIGVENDQTAHKYTVLNEGNDVEEVPMHQL